MILSRPLIRHPHFAVLAHIFVDPHFLVSGTRCRGWHFSSGPLSQPADNRTQREVRQYQQKQSTIHATAVVDDKSSHFISGEQDVNRPQDPSVPQHVEKEILQELQELTQNKYPLSSQALRRRVTLSPATIPTTTATRASGRRATRDPDSTRSRHQLRPSESSERRTDPDSDSTEHHSETHDATTPVSLTCPGVGWGTQEGAEGCQALDPVHQQLSVPGRVPLGTTRAPTVPPPAIREQLQRPEHNIVIVEPMTHARKSLERTKRHGIPLKSLASVS